MSENTMSAMATEPSPSPVPVEPNMTNFDINSLPEKFRGAEDPMAAMMASYSELEGKLGASTPAVDPVVEPVVTPTGKPLEIAAKPTPVEANTNEELFTEFSNKYADNGGKLNDADYKALADKGFNKTFVDTQIAGRIASAEANTAQVLQHFGSDEANFDKASEWAQANMTDAQITQINEHLANPELSGMAAQMLATQYNAAVAGQGDPVNQLEGNSSSSSTGDQAGDVFENDAEMVIAQRHPEYGIGGIYDKNFDAKVGRSLKAGKI